jgi:hypothetical protein
LGKTLLGQLKSTAFCFSVSNYQVWLLRTSLTRGLRDDFRELFNFARSVSMSALIFTARATSPAVLKMVLPFP